MGRLKIFLMNLQKYNEGCLMGEWVKLPVPEDKLEDVKHRIGINERYEEYFITDYESSFLSLQVSEYASISELNQFAEKVEELSDYDYEKLSAVLEMEGSLSISEIIELIDELDNFDLLPDVHDDEALGEYYADWGVSSPMSLTISSDTSTTKATAETFDWKVVVASQATD